MSRDVETYLLGIEKDAEDTMRQEEWLSDVREEEPHIMALTRNRFPVELPKGRRLELVRQQMMRVHRASGHSSFANLQKLLRVRKAPAWAIELAGSLECPVCKEAKQARSVPVVSLKELPGLFEILGMDVFEYEHTSKQKYKFLLMRDRASGLVSVEFLQEYGGDDQPRSWEPSTNDIVTCVCKWLMWNPTPKWILTDSATYFTSAAFLDFCGQSGMGLLTTPAEAHEMLGAEESCIRVMKEAARRLLLEEPDLAMGDAFRLAAHGHNQSVGPSGFSPFQWTRGSSSPVENLPLGLDPSKAFDGMLKLKEKARVSYELANAKQKLSKLNNTVGKPAARYSPGQLVMLWRQKNKPGKVGGSWIGPVRLLLQESGTLWLATGSTLIRARQNQVRLCTRREELQASLEGTAVLSSPLTLETLLRSFTGRNYVNVTGEVPSQRQLQDDVQGAEVLVEPPVDLRPDNWKVVHSEGARWLVRVHSLPRLAMFSPSKVQQSPLTEDQLTGKRITVIRPMVEGADEVSLEDNFKTADEPHRQLQERWRGESRFEIKEEESLDARKSRRVSKKGQKRKNVEEVEQEEQQPGQPSSSPRAAPLTPSGIDGTVLPEVPEMQPLLRERGASTVDGVPATPLSDGNEGEGNHCRVPQCTLPGGHDGPHKDAGGQGFSWEPYGGRVNVEASEEEDESSDSTSSSSSEELRPDVPDVPRPAVRKRKKEQTDDSLFVFEISVEPEDTKFLMNHPRKAAIWLSKKMESKGKEKLWSKMNLEEKYKFDEAQAKELSNVLTARALRSLTSQEELNLNRRQIMQMRWVMTVKNDKSAKARLVVLGYQAPNLTQVMASSPTMSRLGRYVLLTLCANYKFKLKSGDVTSAFLQASQSLEDENLFVWAPPELAVLYGASPQNPSKVLKVCKAFYGLVHAPRKWYEHVCMTLVSQGWTKLRSDGCIFVLLHEGTIRGLAGLHVDDFLIGGKEDDPVFKAAEQALMDSYRWGKWEEKQFEFAGTTITQHSDFSISVNQDDYLTKWLSEVELPKERWLERKALLTAEETSALRGLVGTMSWKASQTGPHYAADVGLLLSSVPTATIDTLIWANKMAREMKRDSQQSICFPSWGIPWEDLAVVTWADASQKNRPDRSSTLGLFTGVGPKEILSGEEASIAIVNWRSAKTPRQCLGSNGAEVQAITEGEDVTFKVRAMLLEFHGIDFTRKTIYEKVRQHTKGALVMDSRGVFDAATRNMSALHGLRSSRAGYELTLAVGQARSVDTEFRWVNGLAQLADALTKSNSRKILLQLFGNGQRWRLIFDPKFLAGKKVRKKELLEEIRKQQEVFICSIRDLALAKRWPWDNPEVRSMGDEISQHEAVPFALDDM